MTDADEIEYRLLLDAIVMKYGYDFRGYARASMERRLRAVLFKYRLDGFCGLMHKLLTDEEFFRSILPAMTVGTSEMFRDPPVFKALRNTVIPLLETHPSLNIWVAGCSSGQEAYSVAILLEEEGLLNRSVIFATDLNPSALMAAQEGIYPAESTQIYTRNYIEAGGKSSLSDYYTADYGFVRMNSRLRDNMVFSEHNLGTDSVFNEFHLVLCRNVLIYFDKDLQNRVLRLFRESLRFGGYLCLGSKENLRFSDQSYAFEVVDTRHRIYRKTEGKLK